jgi:hypothetical protein
MKSKEKDQWPNLGKFRQLVFFHPLAIIMQNHIVGSQGSPRFAKGNFGVSSTLSSIKVSFITKTTLMLDIC